MASVISTQRRNMSRVAVIGANGFIGSHLVDELSAEGHEVTAFDRFRDNTPTFTAEGVRRIRGDFMNRTDLEEAVHGQEVVFHFLSTTSPATAERDPLLDIRTNLTQTVELLDAAVRAGVQHFHFASTGGAIYGPQGKFSYSESDAPEPVSPYAIGKLSIEHYLHYFRVTHGLRSTVFRISNPYGTRQKKDRLQGLIPIALRQTVADLPVTRFGDGSMVRDYVYVEDLVKMIARVVAGDPQHHVYNLGSGVGYTVNEVLATVEHATGRPVKIVEAAAPATFVDRVVLDTTRYREEFGEIPVTSLEEGVRHTLEEMIRDREIA
jgi:UDP-glucose 4-epimerase